MIANNGHTIQVTLQSTQTSPAQMSGYELQNPYTLAEIHFHWGRDDSSGSEHALNKRFYAMEAHLVHYNSKYESFAAAVNSSDSNALAVVGVFVASGDEGDCNAGFDTIAANIPE